MIEIVGQYNRAICYTGELESAAEAQIKAAFEQSEKEVVDLHQRTKEGIETARLNGKQIGHPKGTKLTTKKSEKPWMPDRHLVLHTWKSAVNI